MSRFLIASAVAALSMGSFAMAEAQTQQCRDNQVAGAVLGGLTGAIAGGAIANNDRGFRRGRGFHRGYGRGYGRGYRRGYRRGNTGAGIVIGALAGSLIGGTIASSSADCNRRQRGYAPQPQPAYGGGAYQSGGHSGYGYQSTGGSLAGGPNSYQQVQQNGQTECRMTDRYVNLPNGSQAIEQVQVCRTLPNGAWIVSDY